jgi:hypothetical protein
MRIGFLFNHDQIHQVAHSLPIALALANAGNGAEIVVATTNAHLSAEVDRLTPAGTRLTRIALRPNSAASRSLCSTFGGLLPAAKLLVYRDNLDFFRSLDALVVTERTSLILKTRYGLTRPKMILSDHGAGDRAIGFGASTALFDHILAAGPKIHDRLIQEAGVDPSRLTITGYPKFDAVPSQTGKLPMQANGRPTIVYNPHLSPHLSSWYRQGRAVLDFFLNNPRYNLIFAPHIMLFQRPLVVTIDRFRIRRPGPIAAKYWRAPNIPIDRGSVASTDMTYANAADIYLGDVSSQIYEFVRNPRPCIFLNAHGVAYRGDPNYAHWEMGCVINSVEALARALDDAVPQHHAQYRQIQQSLFDYTFDLTDVPSGVRAARAIIGLVAPEPSARARTGALAVA